MKRYRPLLAIVALALFTMVLAPTASAHPITPIRADGTGAFDGTGWAVEFTGDLVCSSYALASDVRINGDLVEGIGTMHWLQDLTMTCDDGTMVIESHGTWTFANGTCVLNGTVADATGAYRYLIGAKVHQSCLVELGVPLTTTVSLRIN